MKTITSSGRVRRGRRGAGEEKDGEGIENGLLYFQELIVDSVFKNYRLRFQLGIQDAAPQGAADLYGPPPLPPTSGLLLFIIVCACLCIWVFGFVCVVVCAVHVCG